MALVPQVRSMNKCLVLLCLSEPAAPVLSQDFANTNNKLISVIWSYPSSAYKDGEFIYQGFNVIFAQSNSRWKEYLTWSTLNNFFSVVFGENCRTTLFLAFREPLRKIASFSFEILTKKINRYCAKFRSFVNFLSLVVFPALPMLEFSFRLILSYHYNLIIVL